MRIRRKACRHCGKVRHIKARGLCSSCYYKPAVKRQYPPKIDTGGGRRGPEPTAAEIDALVAEQMQCLPSWWWKEWEKQAATGGDAE